MVRHAAWVLNRSQPRSRNQGKTAYEAIHGGPYTGRIYSFAEPVLGHLPEASVHYKIVGVAVYGWEDPISQMVISWGLHQQ